MTVAPTPTNDRECVACGQGTFTDEANLPECEAWKVCLPGSHTVASSAASATSNRVCTSCEPRTYTVETNAAECTDILNCSPGEFVFAEPTPSTDRECAACPAGEDEEGGKGGGGDEGGGGGPDGGSGEDEADGGSGAQLDGGPVRWSTFSANPNAKQCADHKVCIPGEFVAQDATNTSDRICSPCHDGTFSTANNAAECTPVATCFAGT